MPRSVFLGRPLPGPGEPLWTDEDRGWALALLAEEADQCPGCGGPTEVVTDPARADTYVAHAVACHVCAARERAARRMASSDAAATDGVLWRVRQI